MIFSFGKLKTWSPFFSLKDNESFNASKKLPFPTQKELGTVKLLSETERLTLHRLKSQENLSDRQLNNLLELESRDIQKIPYDVLRNNLTVINPTESENGEMIISTPSRHSLIINQTPEGIVMITASDWESTPLLELYILTRRMKEALKDFNGPLAFTNFDLLPNTRQALGITSENIMSLNKDIILDYMEFNRAILGDINYKSFNVKHIQDNIIEFAPNLGILINAYNKLGIIPELNQQEHLFIKSLVDYHNTSIKGSSLMDGLYNFISIKIKDISNDVINKVLGQAPIDPEMDKVKDLVKDAKEYPENQKLAGFMKKFDRGSVYSKYKMLILTLSGKEEVGIEASSLKNFEISSLYNYQTLEEGTREELEDLLFDIRINGRRVQMLANSYARNPDTVKSEKVREVLKRINLVSDAFLTKSGLLSLSTDNAKDPTLPKLNCGPKMISLYNAGVIVGLSVDELTKLLLSDTGILVNKLAESNIFTGKLEKSRVIDIIRYLQRPPSTSLTNDLLNTITPLFKELGLLKNEEKLNKTKLGKILLNKATRPVLLLIFNFLLSPNENSSLLKIDKEGVINNIINSLKGHKDYTGFSYRASKYLEDLEKIENKTKLLEETYLSLKEKRDKKAVIEDLIKSWKYYKENGITGLPGNNVETINEILEFDLLNLGVESNSSSLDKTISNLRSNIYENKYYLSLIKEIYNWLSYQNIIEEKVLGADGFKHNVLYQLLKLAEISEEQSVLRPLMALNQGLPNKVEESMKFYTDFSKIISDRLEILGKEKAQQDPKTLELLQKLSEFNGRLRQQGVINSDDEHYIDLHTYLYDKEYNNIVKNLYGKIKSTTNIFRVVEGVANYKTYLRLADAQVQISLKKSLKYRTSKYIEDKIIPLFNTRKSSNLLLMRKNISSYIDRDLNTLYLLSLKIQVKIPRFKIIEGNLQLLEGKPEIILLGINKKNDLKFKQYVEFILFPKLKNKYPGNDFLSYIGYRNYDYNDDHNSSINLSKIKTSNMKNASDVVQFNLAKLGLTELSSDDITSLFYYNLIAYNNLPGQSSLTSLFEDILRNNRLQAVVNYNEFISNWDKINTISEYNSVEIMKAIAPILKISEVRSSLKIPYFYCLNPETKITYLCYKINSNEGDNEFDDEFDDEFNNYYGFDENDNKASFETIIRESGYGIYGLITPDIEGKPVEMLKAGKYIISNSTLENMQIMDGEKVYSVTDILKIAKEKGFKIEGKNKINPSDIFARLKSSKKYNLDLIESYLNTILYDKPCK